ncbi:hypothetical protein EYF80_028814 [Liparis tanakae]|uniref:Uncharacterized protein n=1 Tax=Liparis tanakae TaxID=230148 RepID=A0A4Z2H7V7_9TELE|nr:hypothetical protein EYF80_028814 [Liparis tanakae]
MVVQITAAKMGSTQLADKAGGHEASLTGEKKPKQTLGESAHHDIHIAGVQAKIVDHASPSRPQGPDAVGLVESRDVRSITSTLAPGTLHMGRFQLSRMRM